MLTCNVSLLDNINAGKALLSDMNISFCLATGRITNKQGQLFSC